VDVENQVPRAVRWAVDHGASVINMSLGSTTPEWPKSWDDAFLYAEQKDVVIVAAAGNRAGGMAQVGAPATIPGVLTVAGVDKDGNASWDSSTTGISIGVAAPAEPLVGGLPEGGYATWSGTSGAAPLVAGVAALIRAKYPDMPARDVVNRILATARDAGNPGVDNLYGHGLLDAHAALTANVPAVAANPMDTIAEWIRVHRRGSAASSSTAAVPSAESTVPVAQAPAAVPPGPPGGALPGVVLAAFGILFAGVLAGGTVHLLRTGRRRRSLRAAEATVAELVVAAPGGRHDVFDDLPEA
jgi:subtilisin family serine protease